MNEAAFLPGAVVSSVFNRSISLPYRITEGLPVTRSQSRNVSKECPKRSGLSG
jgi:hypothetical protein